MGFQDVTYLSSRASFSNTFLENCGRGESVGTTTYPKTVARVGKGMLPVRHFCSNKASFHVS